MLDPESAFRQNRAAFAGLQWAILFVMRIVLRILFIEIKRAIDRTAAARTIGSSGIGAEEVPSLLKLRVFGFGAMRGEEDLVLPSENAKTGGSGDSACHLRTRTPRVLATPGCPSSGVEGNDVPDLGGDNVSRDEVEHAFAVRDSVGVDVTFVGAGGVVAASGFDLHAQEVSVMLDGYVVGRGVSPGPDDGEALLGGAGHEEQLGPFSALLEVFGDVGGIVWH